MTARMRLLTGGLVLTLLGVAIYAVVLTFGFLWLWMPTLGTCAIMTGLVVIGWALTPGRSAFKAGSRTWQNDGLP